MKLKAIIVTTMCLFMACQGMYAQGKLGGFLKKVNKALENTNQALEDVNNTLDGKVLSTASNGMTKTLSPTRDLQLDFVECYDEGHDVVVSLKMTNITDNEIGLHWGRGRGYDDLGNTYEFDDGGFTIGGKDVSPLGVGLPPEIPMKTLIRLKNVDSEAVSIKKLVIDTHQYKGFEVRNIPIARGQEVAQAENAGTDNAEAGSVKVLSPTRLLKLEYKGNTVEGNNNVSIDFLVTNTGDEEVGLNSGSGRAWDDEGNMYEFGENEFTISGKCVSSIGVPIPAGIPVKGCIVLKGISKSAKTIKLVKFDTYQYKGFEIKEMAIDWKKEE